MYRNALLLAIALSASLANLAVAQVREDAAADAKVAGTYDPLRSTDAFTKAETVFDVVAGEFQHHHKGADAQCISALGSPLGGGVEKVALERLITSNGDTLYSVFVQVDLGDWIFEEQAPLLLLADTTVLQLAPSGHATPVHDALGGGVREAMFFDASPADLRRLAGAGSLRAKIGSKGSCQLKFDVGTMASVRQFVSHEVPAA